MFQIIYANLFGFACIDFVKIKKNIGIKLFEKFWEQISEKKLLKQLKLKKSERKNRTINKKTKIKNSEPKNKKQKYFEQKIHEPTKVL